MIYYKLNPQCAEELFLTMDSKDRPRAQLQKFTGSDNQLFTPVEWIDGSDLGFVLVCKDTGLIVSAPYDNSLLDFAEAPPESDLRSVWRFRDPEVGYGAMQLQGKTSQNLNALGDGPYHPGNPVGVWNWARRRPNELWQFTYVYTE